MYFSPNQRGTCTASGTRQPGSPAAFYQVQGVPANSVALLRTRAQAVSAPTGDIELVLDAETGFISNRAFDESRVVYDADYEETQGFSGTFSAFHERLAEDLIRRYDLRGKDILEIGCGKGEFLTLLCERGPNRGVGFDPAYHPERNAESPARSRMTFIQDFYSEKYAGYRGDFVCCKMTLEHIADVDGFLDMMRRAIGDHPDTVVFVQVPEVMHILRNLAFWDIYHEHCSYFSPGALARLFRRHRFEVLNLWTDYDDQYLMIAAQPRTGTVARKPHAREESPEEMARLVQHFAERVVDRMDGWRRRIAESWRAGRRIAIWGGSSKTVGFLTTLGLREEVQGVVDINPYKQGTYLAGSGHEILAPKALRQLQPDIVIIMNPVYHDEIQQDLYALGLAPEIWHIDAALSRAGKPVVADNSLK